MTASGALDELVGIAGGRKAEHAATDAIVLESLTKIYPDGTEAVRGVSLRVAAGECYGILGPNGAGKSTTIGMLGTLIKPTGGRARVAGFDVVAEPVEVRRRIGFAMQQAGVDEFATAAELVVLQGRLQGLAKREATARPATSGCDGARAGGRHPSCGALGRYQASCRPGRLARAPAPGPVPR